MLMCSPPIIIDPPDTICLYSYHWGATHIDIITRNHGDTVIPMKNVYGRVIPGLTRNAVSNRIPKVGAKTVALSEAHINGLKRLQLPITARSHYLTIQDFTAVCKYYKRTPPQNLKDFSFITSRNDPADVLKQFNTQAPVLATPTMAPPTTVPSDFTALSPRQITANLASSISQTGFKSEYKSPSPAWLSENGASTT